MGWLFLSGLMLIASSGRISALTPRHVELLKKELREQILDWTNNDHHHPLIAGSIRLAFHDCVGGCDGCINLANPDNAGLGNYTEVLNRIYEPHSTLLSRADYWILASITSLDLAAAYGAMPMCGLSLDECLKQTHHSVVFRYGRNDCPSSPHTNLLRQFPNAHGDLQHVVGFFRDNFGFLQQEVVALLGAHTLGQVKQANSGFGLGTDQWVLNADQLKNTFFQDLNNNALLWHQKGNNIGTPKQPNFKNWWAHNTSAQFGLMLNADMGLLKDIQINSLGVSACDYTSCPRSATAALVETYAADNALWLRDFSNIFQKMIDFSYGNPNLMAPSETEISGNNVYNIKGAGVLKLGDTLKNAGSKGNVFSLFYISVIFFLLVNH